jgi:hypothetical protein
MGTSNSEYSIREGVCIIKEGVDLIESVLRIQLTGSGHAVRSSAVFPKSDTRETRVYKAQPVL